MIKAFPITKVKQGNQTKYQYEGTHVYDSKEEIYVLWWLMELQAKGVVTKIEAHPKMFELIPAATYAYTKEMKRVRDKIITSQLLDSHDYTPDFLAWFSSSAYGQGYTYKLNWEKTSINAVANRGKICVGFDNSAWIEVKGAYSIYNNHREFAINQKMMMHTHDIYVQKVEPLSLFKHTFYPNRFLWTDGLTKKRVIGA